MTLLICSFAACSNGSQQSELVSLLSFEQADSNDDAFVAHRPNDLDCDNDLPVIEDDILEFNTNDCAYYSVAFELQTSIDANDTITLLLWHNDLRATEPAQAHAAFSIQGHALWEIAPPIPSSAAVYDENFMVPFAVPVGENIVFHLHNHGANSWRLGALYKNKNLSN